MKQGFENNLQQTSLESPESVASERFSVFMEHLGDIEGTLRSSEYETSGNSGEIKIDTDPRHKKLMLVRTDTGALVSAERELATEGLSGCVALFVQGPGVNYLLHLTPQSRLGYYYHRSEELLQNSDELVKNVVTKVLDPLMKTAELSQCHGLLVPNEGNDTDSPYNKSRVSKAWERLRDELTNAGLENVVISEPLPLDQTTLYYSPQESDSLFAGGLAADSETDKKQFRISIASGRLS